MTRPDFDAIVALIPPNARVLDLGCGDGTLLARLAAEKGALVRGVELNEADVRACVGKGLSVIQGDVEAGLADFPDALFDYVVLSQTIQYLDRPAPVVRDMLRVGRRAIISFDNAAHWRARWNAALSGSVGDDLNSGQPRARAITLAQFEQFCTSLDARVERSLLLNARWHEQLMGWRAKTAVFVVSR